MIDTLTIAYAETADFNSAVQHAAQAVALKGISPDSTKFFRQHLAFFTSTNRLVCDCSTLAVHCMFAGLPRT